MTFNLRAPRNFATRNLLGICVSSFFASLGFSFVTPLMPLLVLDLLDGDIAKVAIWVGFSIGLAPLLSAITGPWWGALGDRVGQKRMMQRALISIGLATLLMATIEHPWQLAGLRGVIGVLGGITVACLAAVTATSARQVLGRNIGFVQAAQTLGNVAGPIVGGVLAVTVGLRLTFVIAAGLFALGFALVTWLYRDIARQADPSSRSRSRDTAVGQPRLASSLLFWIILGVLFSANFLDGSFLVMLPLYMPILGAPAESLALLIGLGLSGGALAMAVAAVLSGKFSNRLPSGMLILAMLAGTGLLLCVSLLITAWWQLVGVRVLLGLLAGGIPPLGYAVAAGLVPPSRRGATVGIASSAGLLGWALSPPLTGILMGFDPRSVLIMDLGLVAICAGLLAWAGGAPAWRSVPGAARARLAIFSR